MWLTDPGTKEPSVTVTLFTIGFLLCSLKLLLSGLVLGGMKMGAFSGSDFAAAVGALGTIYAMRKHSDNMAKKDTE